MGSAEDYSDDELLDKVYSSLDLLWLIDVGDSDVFNTLSSKLSKKEFLKYINSCIWDILVLNGNLELILKDAYGDGGDDENRGKLVVALSSEEVWWGIIGIMDDLNNLIPKLRYIMDNISWDRVIELDNLVVNLVISLEEFISNLSVSIIYDFSEDLKVLIDELINISKKLK